MYGAFAKILVLVGLVILVVVFSVNPLIAPIKSDLAFSTIEKCGHQICRCRRSFYFEIKQNTF